MRAIRANIRETVKKESKNDDGSAENNGDQTKDAKEQNNETRTVLQQNIQRPQRPGRKIDNERAVSGEKVKDQTEFGVKNANLTNKVNCSNTDHIEEKKTGDNEVDVKNERNDNSHEDTNRTRNKGEQTRSTVSQVDVEGRTTGEDGGRTDNGRGDALGGISAHPVISTKEKKSAELGVVIRSDQQQCSKKTRKREIKQNDEHKSDRTKEKKVRSNRTNKAKTIAVDVRTADISVGVNQEKHKKLHASKSLTDMAIQSMKKRMPMKWKSVSIDEPNVNVSKSVECDKYDDSDARQRVSNYFRNINRLSNSEKLGKRAEQKSQKSDDSRTDRMNKSEKTNEKVESNLECNKTGSGQETNELSGADESKISANVGVNEGIQYHQKQTNNPQGFSTTKAIFEASRTKESRQADHLYSKFQRLKRVAPKPPNDDDSIHL
ncbi:hypothetical protein AB6A40_006343 [Gnathostoma spinigerum]|uniref:Uncharacterized protein n=1 Tax=Gnathostoma spinigerum TaxID=75299 RepID=A0ABD6EI42_9BILA